MRFILAALLCLAIAVPGMAQKGESIEQDAGGVDFYSDAEARLLDERQAVLDQEGAMESAAFKEFIKRYWIFQTHAEKTQYNPIDVKSKVEQTLKNNELSFTIHKVKDNEVKHIFQSSTIQAVPTNQHHFNGID